MYGLQNGVGPAGLNLVLLLQPTALRPWLLNVAPSVLPSNDLLNESYVIALEKVGLKSLRRVVTLTFFAKAKFPNEPRVVETS